MRPTIPIYLLLFTAICCVSCQNIRDPRLVHDPMATWTPKEGWEYLVVARRFAFGGVSDDGHTSTGEFSFRAVLRSHNAPQLFKAVFFQGTEEGKLYALCGIRVTDRSAFDSYASILVSTNAEVTTQFGCAVLHEPAPEVVKRIHDGTYDSHFWQR